MNQNCPHGELAFPPPFSDGVAEPSDSPGLLEDLFDQYIEATPLGILLVDSRGTITFANSSALSCFGYQRGELLGQLIEILIPVPLREEHVHLRDGYLRQPEQRMMAGRELRGRRKDGTEVPVAIGLNPLGKGDLRVNPNCRVACSVMDLTTLKRAEQDLTRFFELSPDLFCIASVEGCFLRVNPNFARVLGYPDEVLRSRPFLDFVHPDDRTATQAATAEMAQGRPLVRFRNRYRTSHGDYRWFDWSAQAIPEEGTIFANARDITEQVRLEEELLARQRRERAILDNTPAVVYLKNSDGRYEYVNQQHADLFSLDPSKAIGKSDSELFPRAVADEFSKNDRQVLETKEPLTIQETVLKVDGLSTYISVKVPLFDAHGEVEAIAGISTDITDQIRVRETQEQLRLARAFQKKLYPAQAPVVAGLDTAGAAVPVAQVCGDYYDFIPCGPGQLKVAVGDVSGHGIGPALSMVAVRTMLRMLLRSGTDLAHAVGELNGMLCEDLPESSFVSLFLAEIDAPRRQIRYVGAGHDAWLFPAGGEVRRLESTGPLLGIVESARFEQTLASPLDCGDLFLLHTDGLSEAMNLDGEQFHSRRVVEVVSRHRHTSAEGVIQNLFTEMYEFTSGRTILDDMTVIAVKVSE
jgi:PAS domain S-box-containing protein